MCQFCVFSAEPTPRGRSAARFIRACSRSDEYENEIGSVMIFSNEVVWMRKSLRQNFAIVGKLVMITKNLWFLLCFPPVVAPKIRKVLNCVKLF